MKRISSILFLFPISLLLTSCGKSESSSVQTQSKDTALLSFSDAPRYDFGFQAVDSSTEKEFTITNIGTAPATEMSSSFYLSLSFNFKGENYPGEGGTCTDSLNPGSKCTVMVVFNPKLLGPFESIFTMSFYNGVINTSANGPTLVGQGN